LQVPGLFVTLRDRGLKSRLRPVIQSTFKKIYIMGRGDKKTKKGKIFKGSFGKSRPAKPAKKSAPAAAPAKDK
jgi:30S ribosomal protein S31